jgi:hypothetical protein
MKSKARQKKDQIEDLDRRIKELEADLARTENPIMVGYCRSRIAMRTEERKQLMNEVV